MKTTVTVDEVESQFVVTTGNSVVSLSFNEVFSQAQELERRLRLSPAVCAAEIGTMAQFEQLGRLQEQYASLDDKETWFDNTTPLAVRQVLERYRRNGGVVRIYCGDRLTGRDWLAEYDTIGAVSRSVGPMRVPTLVPKGTSNGTSIVTNTVVRIQDVETGMDVYRHPNYHVPDMRLLEETDPARAGMGYTHEVHILGSDKKLKSQMGHRSLASAAHWIAFMHGRVHNLHEAEI